MAKKGKWDGFCFPLAWCRHDDLKEMLDSNKDSLKLEAMKRIVAVGVVATGRVRCWCQAVPCHAVLATQCHAASLPPLDDRPG